jgi:ketosteroid isomerase-like protein
MRRASLAVPLLALSAACAARQPEAATAHGAARHAAEAAMVAADEDFSAASVARDAAGFARLVAPDAVFFSRQGLSEGRDAVVERWRPFLTEGGPTLRWSPQRAEASGEGDLGFTVGEWELSQGGEVATGRYLTVWRRAADGRYEAVLDGTFLDASAAPPAGGASPVRELRSASGDLVATLARVQGADGPALSLTVARSVASGRSERVVETRVSLARE